MHNYSILNKNHQSCFMTLFGALGSIIACHEQSFKKLIQFLTDYSKFPMLDPNHGKDWTIVQMEDNFPFGELKQLANTQQKVLVRKKLIYNNPAELNILKKMVSFLKTLNNEHLISLQHHQLMGEETFFFYYQYVPLTLEKWILDIGDDIIDELQFQMLALANYLTQQNIKFRFDPNSIGLSKQIKVKYFLHQFMIDCKNKMNNYKQVEAQIVSFFKEFKELNQKNIETSTDYTDRKSADSCLLVNRLQMLNSSTRDSWETSYRSLASNKSKKNLVLSEKIEHSKRRSMEILMRLKSMKPQRQQ